MKLIILLTLLSLNHGLFLKTSLKEPDKRIIGGVDVGIGKHGYQISILKKSLFDPQDPYSHSCGGSIYSETIVLTAAHCIIAVVPSQLKVVAGANIKNGSDGVLVPVKEIIMHENFSPYTYNNDVAILILSVPLPLNKFTIRPIELIDDAPAAGSLATITGWGDLVEGGASPSTLQEVKLPVVSQDECNEDYKGGITEYMLCAGFRSHGGKDSCQGDSGGPLTIRNKLAGIVSWGNGCAKPNFPGVYANVWTLRSWILGKIALHQ